MCRFLPGLLVLLLVAPALAQGPVGRPVGRLVEASGPVSGLGPGGWVGVPRGAGLVEGATLRTGPRGQAELELGADRIGLDPDTVLRIDSGNPAAPAVTLERGRAMLLMRGLQAGQVGRVALAEAAVSLTQPGLYVVEAGGGGRAASVGVTRGLAQVFGPGVSMMVPAGRTGVLGPQLRLLDFVAEGFLADDASAPPPQMVRPGVAPPDLSELPGGEVLAREGSWGVGPEGGAVWYPPVAPGWNPYADRWSDQVAWGYAPWHFGTWVMIGPRWGWVPPPRHGRPPVGYAPPVWRGGHAPPAMAQPQRPPPVFAPPPPLPGRVPPAAPHVYAPRQAGPPVSAGLPPPGYGRPPPVAPPPVAPPAAAPHVYAPRPAPWPVSAAPPPMARPHFAAPPPVAAPPPRPMPLQPRCGPPQARC